MNNKTHNKKKVLSLIDKKNNKDISGKELAKDNDKEKSPTNSKPKMALDLINSSEKKVVKKSQKVNQLTDQSNDIKKPVEEEVKPSNELESLAVKEVKNSTNISDLSNDTIESDKKIIHLKSPILIRELADEMNVKTHILIKDLMGMDIFASINQSITADIATRVCQKHGFVFQSEKREKGKGVHKKKKAKIPNIEETDDESSNELRAPVITFMGHVDHGKTSLLDYLRKTKVISKEAGGITQHIGAYQVTSNDTKITFLDTPGHEAFTEMRARGANITDIVALVVAADDGIMPQTREAIDHAKAAGVEMIVVINKCDLPSADPQKIKQQFQKIDITPEEWGGKTIFCEVSATTGDGIDNMLEMMSLQAEVLELTANSKSAGRAIVIESKIETGKGPVATVIVKGGTIKLGNHFICGEIIGKVKLMLDDRGERLKEAGPSTPLEIIGFSQLPNVGEELVIVKNDKETKRLRNQRLEKKRLGTEQSAKKISLEDLFGSAEDKDVKTLNIILKSDVQGSFEAISSSLKEIDSKKIKLEIIHSSAGNISESDVLLASASNAILIGFNTKVESVASKLAKREGVQIKNYNIIYELLDEVKLAMEGLLEPVTNDIVLGTAEILQVFKIATGKVAGCKVTKGKITKNSKARLLRKNKVIYKGKVTTLKRFQEDSNEVKEGFECGIRLDTHNDYAPNDIIEVYEVEEIKQSL